MCDTVVQKEKASSLKRTLSYEEERDDVPHPGRMISAQSGDSTLVC